MTQRETLSEDAEVPEAEVHVARGLAIVWLIPLVAAAVAGGLAYRTYTQKGSTITITFDAAGGIAAGKTNIQYKGVEIGSVTDVQVSPDLAHVVVTAQMAKEAEPHLIDGTRFWIVSPHVGITGVSGLGTLISGVYIACEPARPGGKSQHIFAGAMQQPLDLSDQKGLRVLLETNDLGGITDGSAVYYRGAAVGQILGHAFDSHSDKIAVHLLIQEPYAHHILDNTVFWNASGIRVAAGLTGVKVDLASVGALIAGGIAFDTLGAPGKPPSAGASYSLFATREEAMKSRDAESQFRIVLEASRLGSLKAGDPVLYREVAVGRVVSSQLNTNGQSVGILVEIDAPYDALVRTNSVFWNASGISAGLGLHGVHIQTESLEALLEGGITFATPDQPGARVKAGSVFQIQEKADDQAQDWAPHIWVGSGKDPAPAAVATSSAAAPVDYHYKGDTAGKPGSSHHWFTDLFHHHK